MGEGVGKAGKVGGTSAESDQALLEHYLRQFYNLSIIFFFF